MHASNARPNIEIWLLALCASALFSLWPQIDLWASHLFYAQQPAGIAPSQGFIGLRSGFLRSLREFARLLPIIMAITVLAAAILPLVWKAMPALVPGRIALFLATSLALGPGLMVNALFKEFSGRARPVQISDFGGARDFSPAWIFSDQCQHNCSFISGEVSTAAWTFALFLVAPPRLRFAALIFSAGYMAMSSLLRMAAGAHFLSDALVSIIITQIVTLATYTVIFRGASPYGER